MHGQLDCLKYLHETAKAPWDSRAVRYAHLYSTKPTVCNTSSTTTVHTRRLVLRRWTAARSIVIIIIIISCTNRKKQNSLLCSFLFFWVPTIRKPLFLVVPSLHHPSFTKKNITTHARTIHSNAIHCRALYIYIYIRRPTTPPLSCSLVGLSFS